MADTLATTTDTASGADGTAPGGATAPATGGATSTTSRVKESGRQAADAVRREASTLKQQASEKAHAVASDGKEKASAKLDDVARLIGEAADTVEEKVGAPYAAYARGASDFIGSFANQLRDKDVDALVDDARAFVKKSPVIAIGAAAAVGFVLARLIKAGIDASDTTGTDRPGGGSAAGGRRQQD